MVKQALLLSLFLLVQITSAQILVEKPSFFRSSVEKSLETKIIVSLDSLYRDMNDFHFSEKHLSPRDSVLTKAVLNRYLLSAIKRKKTDFTQYSNQLCNLYPLKKNQCMVSVAHINKTTLELEYKIQLLANVENERNTAKTECIKRV